MVHGISEGSSANPQLDALADRRQHFGPLRGEERVSLRSFVDRPVDRASP
jgi:hypothetical protein